LEPVGQPVAGQPLLLELIVVPTDSCDSMTITVRRQLNAGWTGDTAWTVAACVGQEHVHSLRIVLADTGLCGISIGVQCGRIPNHRDAYFQIEEDTIYFYRGEPVNLDFLPPDNPPPPKLREDTLTEAQLDTRYEVTLKPAGRAQQDTVEQAIGQVLRESDRQPDMYYRVTLTLRQLLKLGKTGIELDIDWVTRPAWDRRSPERERSDTTMSPPPIKATRSNPVYISTTSMA